VDSPVSKISIISVPIITIITPKPPYFPVVFGRENAAKKGKERARNGWYLLVW
jgi:hypothetical protein